MNIIWSYARSGLLAARRRRRRAGGEPRAPNCSWPSARPATARCRRVARLHGVAPCIRPRRSIGPIPGRRPRLHAAPPALMALGRASCGLAARIAGAGVFSRGTCCAAAQSLRQREDRAQIRDHPAPRSQPGLAHRHGQVRRHRVRQPVVGRETLSRAGRRGRVRHPASGRCWPPHRHCRDCRSACLRSACRWRRTAGAPGRSARTPPTRHRAGHRPDAGRRRQRRLPGRASRRRHPRGFQLRQQPRRLAARLPDQGPLPAPAASRPRAAPATCCN